MSTPEPPLDAAEEDPTVPPGSTSDGVPTAERTSASNGSAGSGQPDDSDPPDEVRVGMGPTD